MVSRGNSLLGCFAATILITALILTCTAARIISLRSSERDLSISSPIAPAPMPPERFVMFGDSGTGSPEQFAVGEAIATSCKNEPCNGIIILGDVIYPAGVQSTTDPQFESKFEQPYDKISQPIHIAFGNHDYLGCAECYLQYRSPSSKWLMPARYYVVKGETTSVFVIDTENFDDTQAAWLADQLRNSKTRWNLVGGHRPILTYDTSHHDDNWPGRNKLKEIICNQVDVYLSGHAHLLEDNGPVSGCTVTQLVSGAGGTKVREQIAGARSLFNASAHGFLDVKATPESLTTSFYDSAGKLRYWRRLD